MILRLAALFTTALMATAASSQAQTYNIADLGAVSGDSTSVGYGLNGLGKVAGTSSDPSAAIPTLFNSGKAINLGTFEPGDVSAATALNGSLDVVGFEYFGSTEWT